MVSFREINLIRELEDSTEMGWPKSPLLVLFWWQLTGWKRGADGNNRYELGEVGLD